MKMSECPAESHGPEYYTFAPQPDITPYELALCMQYVRWTDFSFPTQEAKRARLGEDDIWRHFKTTLACLCHGGTRDE